MAAKPAPEIFKIERPDNDPSDNPLALTPEEDGNEQSLLDVLSELGGIDDAKINIYRAGGAKGSRGGAKGSRGGEYIDSLHPAEFSLPWLRDTYGGGEYRVHIRSGGKLFGNRLVRIAVIS